MKNFVAAILCLALLTGCQAGGVGNFWERHSIDYSDIRAAEDQFADFAERAVAAPEEEALTALDALFDKLQKDTVGYYVYAEWMDGAFYSVLSPCRSATLYRKAVDRMVADGVLTENDYAPYLRRQEWIGYNLEGAQAFVPGISSFDTRTLVLVLDLGCPSCREALEKLGDDPQWEGVRKLAVGLGYGLHPDVPSWDFLFPENGKAVFDIGMTPVYFVVAADGTVERGYTLAL
jgi:hypothetical protein